MGFKRQGIAKLTIHPDVLSEIVYRVGALYPGEHIGEGVAFHPEYLDDAARNAALVTISNHPAQEVSTGYLLRWGNDFIYVIPLSSKPYRTFRIAKASMGARTRRLEFQLLFDEAMSGETPSSHVVFV